MPLGRLLLMIRWNQGQWLKPILLHTNTLVVPRDVDWVVKHGYLYVEDSASSLHHETLHVEILVDAKVPLNTYTQMY
jgi:hypothetical protein